MRNLCRKEMYKLIAIDRHTWVSMSLSGLARLSPYVNFKKGNRLYIDSVSADFSLLSVGIIDDFILLHSTTQ